VLVINLSVLFLCRKSGSFQCTKQLKYVDSAAVYTEYVDSAAVYTELQALEKQVVVKVMMEL
jgi:hypothetical protein